MRERSSVAEPSSLVPRNDANHGDGAANSRAPQDQDAPSIVPSLSLPKGGGAIRGMGEKFAANPVTGTGSMSVPIPTSPARSGFGPELSLSYDSGAGNGPFGFGWTLSIPSITRKTEKGLPQYDDAGESDVFILSGSEDLVPLLEADDSRLEDTTTAPGFAIHQYRPRVEGLFARIERWTNRITGEIHWRSITRDNVTTLYGQDSASRIFDPSSPNPSHSSRIFTWLICASYDDKGNAIVYEYSPEDDAGVDRTQANERNRTRTANRYLKRIRYGNRTSRLIQPDLEQASWLFEVVFDYDEGHYAELPPDPTRAPSQQHRFVAASSAAAGHWTVRPDPFSSYRARFEVRTYRRCRRVLMFHRFAELNRGHIDELGDAPNLVRSIDFDYSDVPLSDSLTIDDELAHQGSTRFASFIQSITQCGYVRDETAPLVEHNGIQFLKYLKRSLPPLELEYSKATIQDELQYLDPSSVENLPMGVDGTLYQWVDLDGEGAPGILTEQGLQLFYKPSLGGGRFAPLEILRKKPSLFAVGSGGTQLLDLSGDGQLDVASFERPTPGFYERTQDEGWENFRPFPALPNVRWNDPNLRFVDLDGDGHADVFITEDECFTWYPSLATDGFGPARKVRPARDEEHGPHLVLADGTQSIYLADLSGDGLSDLVRIRNGEVCYWPNVGYGHFGAKVTMDNAPWFEKPDQFDQRRIRLVDIDGSGTTDIIYLGLDGVRLYFNQSGNRWSEARRLRQVPRVDNSASVATADLLGNGTGCLVWSSPLPADARLPLRYVDLMGGQKPHLLIRSTNNLGAETRVDYAASTKFYFADKRAGTPWVTRLAFPVHVVERVTKFDRISGNRFVTRYTYHHGYFDGAEREFRGFGMVEELDTEEFRSFASDAPDGSTNVDKSFHVPPVLTKTWFHTGIYLGRDHVSDFYAGLLDANDIGEYYREPGLTDAQARALLLPDTVLPPGLALDEEREACRALKGMMLRQEVYALDGTDKAQIPFTVTEQNFTIERLQKRGRNLHAVFFAHPREALSSHYERKPSDPRLSHTITLEVDAFGNVLRSLAIGYGRRAPSTEVEFTSWDHAQQEDLLITYNQNSYTTNDLTAAVLAAGHHRAPLQAESCTYHLTGFVPAGGASRFSFDEWSRDNFALIASAEDLAYELSPDPTKKQKRLIEDIRTLYRKDDLTGFSVLGKVESLALKGETYKLALTPSLIDSFFRRKPSDQPGEQLLPNAAAVLEGRGSDEGGYHAWEGAWWVPSGRVFYDPDADTDNPLLTAATEVGRAREHFFAVRKIADAFGHATQVDYDQYDLLMARTIDPLGNATTATNDYRALQPAEISDPNRNRTSAGFDALGMVVATARMGKPEENLGDVLDGFDPDPTLSDLLAFVSNPAATSASLLGRASTRIVYDLDRFRRTGQPPFASALARETHFHDAGEDAISIQVSFSYSDGFAREIQKKIQAEPGDAPQREPNVVLPTGDAAPGALAVDTQGELVETNAPRRWVGSGRTVFNNKGKPVKQYEPFFSATHLYEPEREVTDTGVSSILFYDPLERVVATIHPNHTYEKVIFDPWRHVTYDVNDTVAVSGTQTGDPRSDTDIDGYVEEYFKSQPSDWQTWYAARVDNALGTAEQAAAEKAAAHANTPTVAHLDALGRVFMTVAHNRFARNGVIIDEKYATRVELDIEGNQRMVRDAITKAVDDEGHEIVDERGRIVARYDYDLLSNRLHQASMEAGERWMLGDAAGKRIREWDSRGFARRLSYDELRRLTALFVTEQGAERLAERTVYGESEGDSKNHRTQVFQRFDAAGVVTSVAYDFKGNLKESRRDLLPTYNAAVDWQLNPAATDGSYTSSTTYDGLNRPLTVTSPDGSIYQPTFNEANLLDRVDVRLRGAGTSTPFVKNIDYNAKGQRERIDYGNGARTTYEYDALTLRLMRLQTTRPSDTDAVASQLFVDPTVIQDLRYTYDPIGNVTHIEDAALLTIFRDGQQIDPACDYVYDAAYRLIAATGREHVAQCAFDFSPADGNYRDYPFVGNRANPNDLQALQSYTERYEYDAVGNFTTFAHRANSAGWTRRYDYEEESLLEAVKKSNRLTRTTVGNGLAHVEPYTHDAHGNITSMSHLASMTWDFKDELQQAALGGGGTAFYVYDSSGERIRKVIESQSGSRQKQRLYLGGFEIYREYASDGATITSERESLHVLDDKQRIALVETQTVDGGKQATAPSPLQRYQLGNHLGSASVELDDVGALISYEEYHPFGTTSFQAGRSAAEVSFKRYRYTAKERDDESGLSYHSARYYASWLGRWISVDPMELVDGTNLYFYARNKPTGLVDNGGHQASPAQLDPETIVIAATALQRAAQAWGSAAILSGGGAAAPVGAAAPTAATGVGLEASGAGLAVGAQLAAALAVALTLRLHMQRSGSIVRYGNPYGIPTRDIAFPLLGEMQRMKSEPYPVPEPAPADEEERKKPRPGRIYVTYTKHNSLTGRTYSGRTSAVIDLNLPLEPQADAAVAARDKNHHVDETDEPTDQGFGPADPEKFAVGYAVNYDERYKDVGYLAIRGREQQLIDFYGARKAAELGIKEFRGGAQSDTRPGTPLTENTIRAVSKDNKLGEVFHHASNLWFKQELAPFTGNRIKEAAQAR